MRVSYYQSIHIMWSLSAQKSPPPNQPVYLESYNPSDIHHNCCFY